jgi:hypothetical protein
VGLRLNHFPIPISLVGEVNKAQRTQLQGERGARLPGPLDLEVVGLEQWPYMRDHHLILQHDGGIERR